MPAAVRWVVLSLLALAIMLVPFFLYEGAIAAWTRELVDGRLSKTAAAAWIAALLASDVLLPIPSSLVATTSGYLLGLAPGAAVSWAGMMAGSLIGYALGRKPARRLTRRFVGDAELARASMAHARWGDWAIIVCRAVPVLAEASVVFAGVAGMRLGRFVLLTALSNLAIAAAYAAVGALALEADSFLLAFFGAIALPGIALLLPRRRTKRP
jgi:uncharacterized membrane protein YdjX (TVP38/TMEM64 family)